MLVILVIVYIDPEIYLNTTINIFYRSIYLGIIDYREELFNL